MPVSLILVSAAALVVASACPRPPPVRVHVVGRAHEMTTGTAFDLAQLRELSDRIGGRRKHPTFGFYVSRVFGETAVTIDNDRQDLCAGPVEIEVTINLGDRHIEIGRDLLNDICRFNAVASHYRHHAEADLNLLQRYVAVVTQTLAGAPLSDVIGAAGIPGLRDKTIASTIHAIIEPVLDEMQVYPGFVEIRVYAPRVGVAAGAKPKRYPDF